MQRRTLGDGGLEVSALGFGSWLTVGGREAREVAGACLRAAFDAGITLLDTANAYGQGASEEVWGDLLADYPRDSYILATKVYFPMSATDQGLSAGQIRKQLDASLRRLRTDHIDLYQAHRFDVRTPIEETMEALTEAVAAGKVRHLGFSEWTVEQIRAGLAVPGAARFASSQPQYSLLWRAPEAELFSLGREEGFGNVVFSPLAQGMLSGKYRPGQPLPSDSRAADESQNSFLMPRMNDEVLAAIQRLVPLAQEAGLTLPQLALAWVLRRPEVSAAIIGASRPQQIVDNAKAVDVVLGDDLLAAVDAALGEHPVRDARLAGGAEPGVLHRTPEADRR